MGPKVIQPLAARQADMWDFFSGDPQGAKQICEKFDAICRRVGRDPTQIEKSTSLRPSQLAGAKDEAREYLQAFADAGVRHFVITLSAPYDREFLRRFAKDVIPTFRTT
jgi:alkanesulfonate monooxygenase SsuD/methylene tetrahydromethanopterin reductase-like flavin-dependent oxidoreductase (luciferase family)